MSRFRVLLFALVVVGLLQSPAARGASDPWAVIVEQADERFGEPGSRAAAFLAEHRPARDDGIDPELVLEAIGLALEARERFPWAAGVGEDLFLNDVLPYAVLDEPRTRSRARVRALSEPLVGGAADAVEAAQALNRELFARTGVRYSTARLRANQNPIETLDTGLASCTGLSVLLVEACRSVGIPARIAGIASWPGRGGNHAWVEIHDGERWRFTGAAEYDAQGLDRGWFVGRAAGAVPGHELHGVWASSWRGTGDHYPLAWAMDDRSVPGVDVSGRYARGAAAESGGGLALRLWASRGGVRLAGQVRIGAGDALAAARTFADPDDINRVAELADPGSRPLMVRVTVDGTTRTAMLDASHTPGRVIELYWDELGMSRDEAAAFAARLWAEHAAAVRDERAAELEAMTLRDGDHEMRLLRRDFGDAPEGGRSLWISMHGGGGTTSEVNDRQWRNQIRLYEPEEGVYLAPRAPTDTWNMWHRPEIDRLFDRLIESAVIVWGVDPDRVYLTGYSAGGDGVYQLAPRMADRFAAAAMMAGHPNDATPHGLRNLPFALFMGAEDSAFDRNGVAERWEAWLGELAAEDPGGYPHFVRIYEGLGHWMDGRDREGIPWMAGHRRDPWPNQVVWRQGNMTHARFAWLAVPDDQAVRGRTVRAIVEGQRVRVESDDVARVDLLLSDALLDLDRPVTVIANGRVAFEGLVPRTERAARASLRLRADPRMIAAGRVRVELTPD
ncbi:MAG: hypothetical protein LAT64_05845 [Phycisphaerales bacterium]|nr:hypothetical protein [Planctomycetota bacterium]MCH8508278.1 hypothetical protein [Phycisphaerales bacterium]